MLGAMAYWTGYGYRPTSETTNDGRITQMWNSYTEWSLNFRRRRRTWHRNHRRASSRCEATLGWISLETRHEPRNFPVITAYVQFCR